MAKLILNKHELKSLYYMIDVKLNEWNEHREQIINTGLETEKGFEDHKVMLERVLTKIKKKIS